MSDFPFPVFDIHAHTYPEKIAQRAADAVGAFYDLPVSGNGTYADLEAHALPENVKGFLLFSVATNAHQVPRVNDCIAELAAASRERGLLTVGFAGMHQDFPDFKGELDRARAMGLCGVKIHPDIQGVDIDDPRLLPLYEEMEGRMPLYLHMGDPRPQYRFSEADKLLHVMDMFPRLEVVAAHLGGYGAWDAVPRLAARQNIWFDTSSAIFAMSPEMARDIIRTIGAERVMFGTDYPLTYARDELARFMAIPDLSKEERRMILYDNAIRFLHL